jgi:phage tail protein X
MSESIEKIEVTGAGLTVARLIWNRFRAPMPDMLGQIYDHNPGLAEMGTHIPIGTIVTLPVPDQSDERIVEQITLWS